MNQTPTVSVCIPTYNRAHYLPYTLETILNQTFVDFELVICDDCSTDNTAQVVASFKDSRIRYMRNQRNLGIPGNLNRCVELAQGKYVAIYHDHDLYEPTILEESVDLLDRYPNMGYVATGSKFIDQQGYCRICRPINFPACISRPGMAKVLFSSFASPVGAWSLVRRQCYELEGVYSPSAGFLSDVDLWIRLSAKYDVGFIAKPLVQLMVREESHPYAGIAWELVLLNYQIRIRHLFRVWKPGSLSYHKQKIRLALMLRSRLAKFVVLAMARADFPAIQNGITTLRQGPRSFWLLLKLLQQFPILSETASSVLAVYRSLHRNPKANSEA